MNFDFSDEQKQMRDEARRFLAEKCPPKAVRAVLDGKAPYDHELWKGLAEMGFLGVAIPEAFGGCGCRPSRTLRDRRGNGPREGAGAVLLHRLSRRRGAAARRLRRAEAEMAAQDCAAARPIGTLALFEGNGNPSPKAIKLQASGNGALNGVKKPVPDGAIADFAVVAARTGSTGRDTDISLFLVDLKAGGVEAKSLTNCRSDPGSGRAHLQERQGRAARRGR